MKLPILLLFPLLSYGRGFFPETFRASFTEERIGVLSKKKIVHTGLVEYKYPGHLRFEVQGPIQTVLVIGPEKTWYYTAPFVEGEKGELKITATKKGSLGKVFDLMKGGLESNGDYRVTRRGKRYELVLREELEKELGVGKIDLTFGEKTEFRHLQRMDIVSGGKAKSYIFRDIRPEVAMPKARFLFRPPPDTNVTVL